MKKNTLETVFILDASGSMHSLTEDTIGGFNFMLAEQRGEDAKVLVSTVCFNDTSRVIHDRVDIKDVKDLTDKEYRAGGCTALVDAIGDAIHHISNVHKYIRKEDVPDRTLFVITTDGMENASHKYSSDEVKKMIAEKRELGWEFIYMAANIDAVETAASIGIDSRRAVNYEASGRGERMKFRAASKAMAFMSLADDDIDFDTDGSWREELDKNNKRVRRLWSQ